MLSRDNTRFVNLVDEAARRLVAAEHHAGGAYIKLPVLYPSGTSAVVLVQDGGERFFVSDGGSAHQEASLMGGAHGFASIAGPVAERAGIRFDNHCFFVVEASREQLPGAIATVASASIEAATLTAYRMADRRGDEFEEFVFSRLAMVFPRGTVIRAKQVVGASNHAWTFSAKVRLPDADGVTLFEAVANHPASVAAASTKFHDVARLEQPPRRVAVVRDKARMGTLVSLLAQAANVVEVEAEDETLRNLARAA